mgnify:CR=1 FL=1
MFHVRREGTALQNGFNFYPWSERKSSIGFIWGWNGYAKFFRWSVHARRFIFQTVRSDAYATPECHLSPDEAERFIDTTRLEQFERCIDFADPNESNINRDEQPRSFL